MTFVDSASRPARRALACALGVLAAAVAATVAPSIAAAAPPDFGPRSLNRRFGLSEPDFSPTGRTILVAAKDSYHREIALIDLADRSRLYTPHSVQGDSPTW